MGLKRFLSLLLFPLPLLLLLDLVQVFPHVGEEPGRALKQVVHPLRQLVKILGVWWKYFFGLFKKNLSSDTILRAREVDND